MTARRYTVGKKHTLRPASKNSTFKVYKAKPEIKLCGNWLRLAGFEPGEKCEVVVFKNSLIINRLSA